MVVDYFILPNGIPLHLIKVSDSDRIDFRGSATGDHSLLLKDSTDERIQSHWHGYKANALRNYWENE